MVSRQVEWETNEGEEAGLGSLGEKAGQSQFWNALNGVIFVLREVIIFVFLNNSVQYNGVDKYKTQHFLVLKPGTELC